MNETVELLVRRTGRLGWIHLNRPQVLNALTLNMVRLMDQALEQWRVDPKVDAILVTGQGDRAFCAGGDVKSVYFDGRAGNLGREGCLTADFFREEYVLNYKIANYPKPYISWLDGVTMGGGVGISILGSHRIASEYLKFAMPETAIGFFPDVGGSYFMSRLGPTGTMLALSGQSLDHTASLALGIATHFVPRSAGKSLVERCAFVGVSSALKELSQSAPHSDSLDAIRSLSERCFATWNLAEILQSLQSTTSDAAQGELAQATLDTLHRRSPTSLKVTLEQLRRGSSLSLAECLKMEYRISQAAMQAHDFFEGIRAALVDKDHRPRWQPASVDEVTEQQVASHFQHLGDRELRLPE